MNEILSVRPVTPTRGRGATSGATKAMPKASFNRDELNEVRSLFTALGLFRQIRRDMPLQYVITLLLVATEEGKTVTEYARMLGLPASVMSRHLLDIGVRNRKFEEGFGLVSYEPNPANLREHNYYLTEQGRALVHQAIRALRR